MRKTLLMDRDGTMIEDKHYLSDPNQVEFLDGVIETLLELRRKEFQFFVITNQSGVGRGFFGMNEVNEVNKRISAILKTYDIEVKEFLICPHKPEDECNCRKPRVGLFKEIEGNYCIDIGNTYMIGDKMSDIEFGRRIGAESILIQNSKSMDDNYNDLKICSSFKDILKYIEHDA